LREEKGPWSVRERKSLGEKERPYAAMQILAPAPLHIHLHHCTCTCTTALAPALAPALPLFFLPNITIEKTSKIRRRADLAGRGKHSKI